MRTTLLAAALLTSLTACGELGESAAATTTPPATSDRTAAVDERAFPDDVEGALSGMNVLLLTLDTTRADFLSCYSTERVGELTPNLDALAADGALFENAYSQTNVTNPSHAAILTGLYGIDSRILNNRTTFPEVSPQTATLATAFREAGYSTANFLAAPQLTSDILDMPGFDDEHAGRKHPVAGQVVDDLLGWVDREGSDGPFFAWAHFYDPHTPYSAPEPYQRRFYEGDPESGTVPPLSKNPHLRRFPVGAQQFGAVRDADYPEQMYKAEIAYVDDQIGRVVDGLRERGLLERTAVVVVADHGESLGEHQVWFDHFGLHEENLRIPFLVRLPGFPGGVRIDDVVTHVDIAPTFETLFGVTLADGQQRFGLDLSRRLAGQAERLEQRPFLVHEDAHNRFVALRSGRWKYIRTIHLSPPFQADEHQLYDLARDPRERMNLAGRQPELVDKFARAVQRWVEQGKWQVTAQQLSPEQERELEAMGYLGK